MAYDLVIRHGRVVDGTGVASKKADVAVAGDKIVEIGDVSISGESEIDATGKTVTPGFVDIHTHLDLSLIHISEPTRPY